MPLELWRCQGTQSLWGDALLMSQRYSRVDNTVRIFEVKQQHCFLFIKLNYMSDLFRTVKSCQHDPSLFASPPFVCKSITHSMFLDWRWVQIMLKSVTTNKARCHCIHILCRAEPEPCRASGTQSPGCSQDSGTAGRATYQGTSLVVTIPCAWLVFGPFCHFAL